MKIKKKSTNAHGLRQPRRPRWVPVTHTMQMAHQRATGVTADEVARFIAPMRASLAAMAEGRALGDHYRVLFSAYWFVCGLERAGDLAGALGIAVEHVDTMQSIEARHFDEHAGTWSPITAQADELETMTTMVDVLETQLLNCRSWAHFERAKEIARSLCRQEGGRVEPGHDADAMLARVMGRIEW